MDLQLCGEYRQLLPCPHKMFRFAFDLTLVRIIPFLFFFLAVLQNGWTGDRCDIDLCDKFCDDTGTASCNRSAGDFDCVCADHYTGLYCDRDLCDLCDDTGTASCSGDPYEYTCDCSDGYNGRKCEIDLCDKCSDAGTASCTRTPGGYDCVCSEGFTGRNCQTTIA